MYRLQNKQKRICLKKVSGKRGVLMINHIAIEKLKEHPKNEYYFTDLDREKYEEIKRSIQANGIRDPIKCTTSYTVISGHQRLKIAKDLGMKTVPVQIVDVDEWEAEYLLIAENVERRGQAESDPIKKARIAKFLKEYWNINHGGSRRQNGDLKTLNDVAKSIGENKRNTERILKLNDLIPELQQLVSEGKLGTTAGEQLAYLSPENQRTLLKVLGEEIAKTTVAQAKEYRQIPEIPDNKNDLEEMIQKLKHEKEQALQMAETEKKKREQLEQEYKMLASQPPKVVEKVVEKIVDKTDYKKIEELTKRLEQMSGQIEKVRVEKQIIQNKLEQQQEKTKEYERLKKELEKKNQELLALSQEQARMKDRRLIYANASRLTQEVGKWTRQIRLMIHERGNVNGDQEVYNTLQAVIKTLEETITEIKSWMEVEIANENVSDNETERGEVIDVEFAIVD